MAVDNERIVLLRGVNVGRNRRLPMADLRAALDDAGFEATSTYIQSGNVVTRGGPDDDSDATALVEQVLAERFELNDVPVVVRRAAQLEVTRMTSASVFPPDPSDADHDAHTHVVFLGSVPPPTRRASLDPEGFGGDRLHLHLHDRVAELHVCYADGAATSKLTTERIERAYGVRATARNLRTVDRLIAMLS